MKTEIADPRAQLSDTPRSAFCPSVGPTFPGNRQEKLKGGVVRWAPINSFPKQHPKKQPEQGNVTKYVRGNKQVGESK